MEKKINWEDDSNAKKRKKVHNQHTNKYKVEQIEKINKHKERTYKRQNKEKICKDWPKEKE